MEGYGAVDNRPKSTIVLATIVGIVIAAALIGGVIYVQLAEQTGRDTIDRAPLEAELVALETLEGPLADVREAATPSSTPAEFTTRLQAARDALAAYRAEPRRVGPLPSGRAWPAQFSSAERAAEEAIEKYGLVATYLDIKEKSKSDKDADPVIADTNIRNVSDLAGEPHAVFEQSLSSMRKQRDAGEWVYKAPK